MLGTTIVQLVWRSRNTQKYKRWGTGDRRTLRRGGGGGTGQDVIRGTHKGTLRRTGVTGGRWDSEMGRGDTEMGHW